MKQDEPNAEVPSLPPLMPDSPLTSCIRTGSDEGDQKETLITTVCNAGYFLIHCVGFHPPETALKSVVNILWRFSNECQLMFVLYHSVLYAQNPRGSLQNSFACCGWRGWSGMCCWRSTNRSRQYDSGGRRWCLAGQLPAKQRKFAKQFFVKRFVGTGTRVTNVIKFVRPIAESSPPPRHNISSHYGGACVRKNVA